MRELESINTRALAMIHHYEALVIGDHFVYRSGDHGSDYFNKDALYPVPSVTKELCSMIASYFCDMGIETVVGPATGGIILAHDTADALNLYHGNPRLVRGIFADKTSDDGFELKRMYDRFVTGKRVLVVEDAVNKGGSVSKVVDLCEQVGGKVVGAAAIVSRSGVQFVGVSKVPLKPLIRLQLESWSADSCHLCREGVPINTDLGKGSDFLKAKAGLV